MPFDGEEIIQQDANEEVESSEPLQESPSEESNQEASASEPESPVSRESQVPFHEHPRFKELIEERRTMQSRLEEYDTRMAEMERRYQEALQARQEQSKQEHPFIQRLKEIDPTYGEWAGNVDKLISEFNELREWKQAQETQTLVRDYESSIDRLHAEFKVPKEQQGLYRKLLDASVMSNPKLGLKDLPSVYKQVHEDLGGLRRAERASYVQEKAKDSSAPASQPKGKPAVNRGKPEMPVDREAAYAQIVKQALNRSKAESDL